MAAVRKVRRRLTRDMVIQAGLQLIDRANVEAVTMRGLAKELGVTPMALYNHFSNKRELLRAVAAHVIDGADFDGGHANWQDQLRHCFRTLRNGCLQHPGMPRLLEIEGAAPTSVFAPMDVAVTALKRAGLDRVDSLRTYFLLVDFTFGQADYQTRGPFPDLEPAEAPTWDFDASFDFGLTLIITGVEQLVSATFTRRP